MGVEAFDRWSSERLTKSMPLASLKDSVIGIDAIYFLKHLLSPTREPLLPALGGQPMALEAIINKELDGMRAAGFKPHFVFSGLEYGIKDDRFRSSIASAEANASAFEIYENNRAPEAIQIFKTSGSPTPEALAEFLKKVLHEAKAEFTVAPYSALAQLTYYEKDPSQFVDAIYGPSEMFLYNVDKLITKMDIVYEHQDIYERGKTKRIYKLNLVESSFSWIDRRNCLEELNRVSPEGFTDACLLAGSNLLPVFPPLENTAVYAPGNAFQNAVNLVNTCGRSAIGAVNHYQEDPRVKELDYVDKFRKTLTGIRHHIVITRDGKVETLDAEHAPSDVHDCIGQRLPEELNMYLLRGMLRPRVLNWLTSGTILIPAPFDGGNSKEYQNLVKTKLDPQRRQALCLVVDSMNRYYQHTEIVTRVWFDQNYQGKFKVGDLPTSSKKSLKSWMVMDALLLSRLYHLGLPSMKHAQGSLYYALCSLMDKDFALRTVSVKHTNEDVLRSFDEIQFNVIWRFLQLREYVDENHQLTRWGTVLAQILTKLGPKTDQDQAVMLAVELLRLDLLNPDTMFPDYSGAPVRGSEIDRRNCMLVSRVACLGKLRHEPRGYSGPLSRHLLAYHSIISEVHASLRDLVEMSLATLFLEGHADRNRSDWMDLSIRLPFYAPNTCGLGVVVKTYLDELSTRPDPSAEDTREMKKRGQTWVEYSDFSGSLEDAFTLWDAVYAGVMAAGDVIKDYSVWEEVDQWLSQRR